MVITGAPRQKDTSVKKNEGKLVKYSSIFAKMIVPLLFQKLSMEKCISITIK